VPRALELARSYPAVLALGGELKNAACLVAGDKALFGPHSGDLENPRARDFCDENLKLLQEIAGLTPSLIACDRHPGYHTSVAAARLAQKTGARLIAVQHHHAHILSCLAENRLETAGPVVGLALDGTGYGDDGRIWGGEFLWVAGGRYRRLGQIAYFPLPGGEKAIREPWRIALAALERIFPTEWPAISRRLELVPAGWDEKRLRLLLTQDLNRPLTSALGRLFDLVAALLGIRRQVAYEGQAAMALEAAATENIDENIEQPHHHTSDIRLPAFEHLRASGPAGTYHRLDPQPTLRALVEKRLAGVPITALAEAWHTTVISSLMELALTLCREQEIETIALSGGCFQNRLLLSGCRKWQGKNPAARGLRLYSQAAIPSNDGGLALGQALAAALSQQEEK
jgi:hydrogenase maturation protein HypF